MAEIGARSVDARSAIQARIRVAFVDAELTIGPGGARRAEASIGIDSIDAGAAVHARAGRTIFVVRLTIRSGES